jgi:hypothetical protein
LTVVSLEGVMAAFEPPSWAAHPTAAVNMQAHPHDASAASTAAPAEPIPLDGKPYYLLGRNGEACDVAVDHSSASRMHAALVHHSNGRCALLPAPACSRMLEREGAHGGCF